MVHQIGQEAIFVAGELDGLAIDGDAAGARIEPHGADREVAGGAACGATQEGAHPRQHLLHVEGFGDIVVCACVDALHLFAPAVARSQDQDRHGAAGLAPGLQDREPVALRQADIEHDGVIGFGVPSKPALFAVEGAVDGVAGSFQRGRHLAVEVPIVFDNQQAHSILVSRVSS